MAEDVLRLLVAEYVRLSDDYAKVSRVVGKPIYGSEWPNGDRFEHVCRAIEKAVASRFESFEQVPDWVISNLDVVSRLRIKRQLRRCVARM